jgi:glycogen debranching enzyme
MRQYEQPLPDPIEIDRQPGVGGQVLKTNDAFAIFDDCGNVQVAGSTLQGLFLDDTRFLSRLALTTEGKAPLFLSSTVTTEGSLFEADLTNPDLPDAGAPRLPRDSVHIRNALLLSDTALFQTLELTNYAMTRCGFHLELSFAADFIDLFELRGAKRARRGEYLPAQIRPAELVLGYRGLDHVERRTQIEFAPAPAQIVNDCAHWSIELEPGRTMRIEVAIHCLRGNRPALPGTATQAREAAKRRQAERDQSAARLETGNDPFDEWLARSSADLAMLITDTPEGPYPYAGVPWFSTAFGRDGLITALEYLWLDPSIAAGTLRYLAARQATEIDTRSQAQPGKILHETRRGEMAVLGEIPYGLYYGGLDTTPLFVMLADAYHARTGDLALIRELWPNIDAAAAWMADYGDADGDGFLEYHGGSDGGLVNQGWKDSGDAIFHRDGRLAEAPIAPVEVQAYAHAAGLGAARLARLLGFEQRAAEFESGAAALEARFDAAFWCEELGTYALALDRDKKQCQVRASNAGHVLFAGLAGDAHAKRVAELLLAPDSFSGWGVRTVAKGESRYNPMSYHNGSIWPHDNALIGIGLARYGLKDSLLRVMTGLFGTASATPLRRLPELFCGFARRAGAGPVGYPVACSPQAWSSAAVFALLGAAIGVAFDAEAGQVRFRDPVLPSWLPNLRISNLRLGDASIDLVLERRETGVTVQVRDRRGEIGVVSAD